MRRHPCPGTFSLISRSFYCTGIFCGLSRKTRRNFLPTQKGASAPGFSPVLRRLLFSSALQPSKAHLLIVLVLAVRSAFLGAVLALVLLSIFRIILVGLFLCVIVLGHNALLFSPLLFSMKIKMQQIIFVAQERLSILAAITVSPAFTDTSIGTLQENYTHRLSRKKVFLSPVGEFFPYGCCPLSTFSDRRFPFRRPRKHPAPFSLRNTAAVRYARPIFSCG